MFQVKDIDIENWKSFKYMVVKIGDDRFLHYQKVYNDFNAANRASKSIRNGFLVTTREVEVI